MKRTKRERRFVASRAIGKRAKVSGSKVAHDDAGSADPIGRRMAMMMDAPSTSANPEAPLMDRERVTDGGEVARTMLHEAFGAHRAWSDYWFQQMQRTCTVFPQLAASRTPTRVMQVAINSVGASIADFFAVCMNAANLSVARATARAGTDKFKG